MLTYGPDTYYSSSSAYNSGRGYIQKQAKVTII